jgi:hypothetical protein
MSGYIAGLLARTFGEVPSLAPRTPSLFEPVPDPAPEPVAEPPRERTLEPPRERTVDRPASVRGETAREPRRIGLEGHAERVEAPVTTHEAFPRSRHGPSPSLRPPSPRAAGRGAGTVETEQRTLPVPERDRIAGPPRQPAAAEIIGERAAPPVDVDAEAEAEPRQVAAPAKIVRAPEAEQPHEARIALPEPPRTRRAPALPPRNERPSPRALSPQQPRRRGEGAPSHREAAAMGITAHQPAADGEQPSIRVTIGRVDVRAVVKADTPRAARNEPQGPRLSLEDYLRIRDGGSR